MRFTRLLMSAGHHAPKYTAHADVAMPHVPAFHRYMSKVLGATMWFWIFYRIKEDGPVMFGYKKPWELHGDHGDHGGHAEHAEHAEEHAAH